MSQVWTGVPRACPWFPFKGGAFFATNTNPWSHFGGWLLSSASGRHRAQGRGLRAARRSHIPPIGWVKQLGQSAEPRFGDRLYLCPPRHDLVEILRPWVWGSMLTKPETLFWRGTLHSSGSSSTFLRMNLKWTCPP